MNEIEEIILHRLRKQSWVADYGPSEPDLRAFAKRLVNHVLRWDEILGYDSDMPVIPNTGDLLRVAALLKTVKKLQAGIADTKHVLDSTDRTLKAETPQAEDISLSDRLQPLLKDLETAGDVVLHRKRGEGAPQKKEQEYLLRGIALQIERLLTRLRIDEGSPTKKEVAKVTAEIVQVINMKLAAKTIQNLLSLPI